MADRLSTLLRNPEFFLGAVVGGILLGIGWAVGSNLVNLYGPSFIRAPQPNQTCCINSERP